jgi:hypothetical protein
MPGIAYYQITVRQFAKSARQVWQPADCSDVTLQIGRLDTAVMNIQKQQFLTDPSGAFGVLQTTINTDQSFG